MPVLFGRQAPRCDPERPGGDHERAIGARERFAEGFDGATIRLGGTVEVPGERDFVFEREVDDAVRDSRRGPQRVEIVEGAAVHRRPGGREGSGGSIRARKTDDLMARADELGDDGGADPAGCAGDEYTHAKNLQTLMSVTVIRIAR